MTGLFDDVLAGNYNGAMESAVQLSYEEESYIENEITSDPCSLSNYCSEGFEAITASIGAIAVSEGLAAVDILKGKSKQITMESLASRAADAYDTIKRWAAKIWKAIKKFVAKAWAHIKHIADKVKAFFTNYESVLRDVKGQFKVPWCSMNIASLAMEINSDYNNQVDFNNNITTNGRANNTDQVRMTVIAHWRNVLYGRNSNTPNGNSDTNHGGAPGYVQTPWDTVKPEVLRVTTMGYDKWSRDFLNWGEKDFREAISLDKDEVDDRRDQYDDLEPDKDIENQDDRSEVYNRMREHGRYRLKLAKTKLQLRQRGCQMLAAATTRHFNQCIGAAKIALKQKHGVNESTYYDNSVNTIASMFL